MAVASPPTALTRKTATALNAIHAILRDLPVTVGGMAWRLTATVDPPSFVPAGRVVFLLDGARVTLWVDSLPLHDLVARLGPDLVLAALPAPLRAAVLEVALEDALTPLAAALGRQPAVAEVALAEDGVALALGRPATGEWRLGLRFDPDGGGQPVAAALDLGGATLMALAELVAKQRPPAPAALDTLPVAVAVELGRTRLGVAELRSLEPGDVVLLERVWLDGEGGVLLTGLPGGARAARWTAGQITVQEGASIDMANDGEGAAGAAAPAGIDGIPVELVVEAGRLTLTLAQVQGLAPGQVLALPGQERGRVTVRANGAVVGSGELVEIDGTVGIRLLEFAGRHG